MNWYFSPDGTQKLEVSDEALISLARDGRLTGDMLLWREGLPGWRPARDLRPDLFPGAGESPPPAPPPSAILQTTSPAPVMGTQTGQLGGPPHVTGAGPHPGMAPYALGMPMRPSNSDALTSLISGIIGIFGATTGFCCCFGFFAAPVAGLIAVIYGHQAHSRLQAVPGAENDRTMALIGLILGYLSLALTVGVLIFNLIFVGFAGMAAVMEEMKRGNYNF